MPGIEGQEPTPEQVKFIRNGAREKFEELGLEKFSGRDIDRLATNDDYVARFFKHVYDNPGKQEEEAVELVIQAFKWRKEFGVEDISFENVNKVFFEIGALFSHNRDKDGKKLLVFEIRKHSKGEVKMEEVKKFFVYFLEKLEREENGDKITIMFDCSSCGLRNLDMDFVQFIISCFQDFYPWFLNYILVFGMPWILNPAWKIIKGWLPPAGVKLIKFVNKANITDFVDKSNALEAWGGTDPWVYVNDWEVISPSEYSSFNDLVTSQDINKNDIDRKKSVTFTSETTNNPESLSLQDKKSNDLVDSVLRLVPGELVVFSPSSAGDLTAQMKITNVSSQISAFKIKTTSPEKYRVRPSIGVLPPGNTANIEIQLVKAYASNAAALVRDKFLVTAVSLDKEDFSQRQLQETFKFCSPVEKFTLRCSLSADHEMEPLLKSPVNLPNQSSDKQLQYLVAKVHRLVEQNEELTGQVKTCHFIQTAFLMVILGFIISNLT